MEHIVMLRLFLCQDFNKISSGYCQIIISFANIYRQVDYAKIIFFKSIIMKKKQTIRKAAIFLQGKLENGEIFEETPPDHPVLITLGQNSFFPVIEQALYTMKTGETRTFSLSPDQAYGPHHKHLVQKIDRSVFGNRMDPQPGMILSLSLEGESGPEQVPATVIAVSPEYITVDYNHPLAGKEVTYIVTLQEWID